ncbi:MAG: lytic transglycosylase domain-containing protein [Chitinophagaceae bacterium]
MKLTPLFSVLTTLLIMSANSIFANNQDSITIIKVSDKSTIPAHLKIVKEEIKENNQAPAKTIDKNATDSTRFVKRKLVDNSEKPSALGNFKISSSIYGPYTTYILDYVKNYHKNHGSRLARIQKNYKGQFKLIENIMRKYKLPHEMKSLAIIESAMNCNAVSPVGAVGAWQFMEGTAKMMGLRVDESIDERRDFYKSTNAAAKYLKRLHGMFHDWLLVIAAYNSGPAPVLRAINAGNGRSFWDIKKKLPGETQNHVMAFIATTTFLDKHSNVLSLGAVPKEAKGPKANFSSFKNTYSKSNIKNNKEEEDDDIDIADDNQNDAKEISFSQVELDQMAILKIKGKYKIESIATLLDEDVVKLRRWNPNFNETISSSTEPIKLRIPLTKIDQFLSLKEKIIQHSIKG